jgi:RNA polymerase sigma-70 factor (ECF subfamily)
MVVRGFMERPNDLKKLVNLCKKNNSQAQHELFKCYKDMLYAICLRYSTSSAEAEDMLMTGWLRIFSKIDLFEVKNDFRPAAFESWMRKIIINNSINQYRINKPHIHLEQYNDDKEDLNTKPVNTRFAFSEEQLIECVQKLPPALRLVFNMSALDQYSHKEISEELNITTNSIKSNLYKARKILREELEKIASDERYR